jgi:hypothetical protein
MNINLQFFKHILFQISNLNLFKATTLVGFDLTTLDLFSSMAGAEFKTYPKIVPN